MTGFEEVCRLGENLVFEMIITYVGGHMQWRLCPLMRICDQCKVRKAIWQRIRSWMVLSKTVFVAWLQYQRADPADIAAASQHDWLLRNKVEKDICLCAWEP